MNSSGHTRFNEAAGIPRGRLGLRRLAPAALPEASMRPRVFPAEDIPGSTSGTCTFSGFNEAAGIPRGRRAFASKSAETGSSLQ